MRREKGIVSPSQANQPTLYPDVVWLWQAFLFLTQRRQYGFDGPLPISAADMKAYADMAGIEKWDDLELYLAMISKLDAAWMADYESNRKNEETVKQKQKPRGRGRGG